MRWMKVIMALVLLLVVILGAVFVVNFIKNVVFGGSIMNSLSDAMEAPVEEGQLPWEVPEATPPSEVYNDQAFDAVYPMQVTEGETAQPTEVPDEEGELEEVPVDMLPEELAEDDTSSVDGEIEDGTLAGEQTAGPEE